MVGSNGSAILMRGKSATCRQTLPLYPEGLRPAVIDRSIRKSLSASQRFAAHRRGGAVKRRSLRVLMNLYATMNDNESSSVLRAITWAGANSYVLSRGLDLDLSISAVAAIVGRIIPKQILRAQLGRDGCKGLR